MKKKVGNPDKINQSLISLIEKLKINYFYLKNRKDFRDQILEDIELNDNVLDIGKAMRNHHKKINCENLETLDVNDFGDYPDIICDICSDITGLENKYDKIICIAILEHVYDPFKAVSNLKMMLKNGGKILYVSGELISFNLEEELRKEGYEIIRIINYSVEHNDEIKDDLIEELKKNIPDIVYVYSENSSKSFLNIIKKYQLIDSWMNTNLMCIGEKTSSVLNEVKWKKIFLFSPGEEEFLLYKV